MLLMTCHHCNLDV